MTGPARHPSSRATTAASGARATYAVVEWSRRIYQNHLRRRAARSAGSVRYARNSPVRCHPRAGSGRSPHFRCRRLRRFRGCIQPRRHRCPACRKCTPAERGSAPQMPQFPPAPAFQFPRNPSTSPQRATAEQAAAIPAIDSDRECLRADRGDPDRRLRATPPLET